MCKSLGYEENVFDWSHFDWVLVDWVLVEAERHKNKQSTIGNYEPENLLSNMFAEYVRWIHDNMHELFYTMVMLYKADQDGIP